MKFAIALTLLLLAGCAVEVANVPDGSDVTDVTEAQEPPTKEEQPLEQLPSTLSIPYFADMRLEGTDLVLDAVLAKNDTYTRHSISYKSNGLRITGILNVPNGDGPFPLLIFNHGYIATSVYTQGRGLKREQDYMAREGFAVLHTDYRGHAGSDKSPMDTSDEKIYDGGLEYAMDSFNAVLAVRAAVASGSLTQIDPERVGMLGHSMGGGVTMSILTARPEMVDAAVLYAPVHADVWENFWRWRREREEGDLTFERFKTKEENPEVWAQLSPQTFLSDIRVPVMLFQGARDNDVPKEWSDDLAQRMRELGKDFTYVEYPYEGHEFATQWSDFMQKSADFFAEHLGKDL